MSELPQELVDKLKGMSGESHILYNVVTRIMFLYALNSFSADEEKQKLFHQCLYNWDSLPSAHEKLTST